MFRQYDSEQPLYERRNYPNAANQSSRFYQGSSNNMNPYTVNCNELRERDVGKLVQISGRTMKQKHGRFIQIKDPYGTTQLVVSDDRWDILDVFSNIPHDSVLEVIGWVAARPPSSVNTGSDTGAVEVRVEKIVNFVQNKTGDLDARNDINFKNWAKLTSEEYKRAGESQAIISRFENRKITCGDLRFSNVGQFVTLVGWVEVKKFGKFVQIQDGYGSIQVVIPDQNKLTREVSEAKIHTVVEVKGHICARPQNQINRRHCTGDIEVNATHFSIINPDDTNEVIEKTSKPIGKRILKLTTEEEAKCTTPNILARFNARQHTCGGLRLYDVGTKVSLIGWVHTIKLDKFIHIKDGYGLLQVVGNTSDNDKGPDNIQNIKIGTLIEVLGKVTARPPGQVYKKWATGEVELSASSIKAIDPNEHFESPFVQEEEVVAKEGKFALADNNSFSTRTHTCGELNLSNVGESVTLAGWLEFQRMKKFFTLRDGYGSTQVIIPDKLHDHALDLNNISYETILEVEGKVSARPQSMINDKLKTGEIEVVLQKIKIVNNVTEKLPFDIRNFSKAKEHLRMRYRYMDLRYETMQENLRLRSKMLMKMREYLINEHNFVEVETPTLFRRTPGGAQEFVVPTRYSGQFYSLVQSPQQFKQMLMAGAIDRYFQIARCYRDEGARPDRQPEFTQLDIEMSFPQSDGLLKLIEGLLKYCWPSNKEPIKIPFSRISYVESMEKYGTDQPDTSFGFELQNLTNELSENNNLVEKYNNFGAYAIHTEGLQAILPAQMKKSFEDMAMKNFPHVKFIQSKLPENDIDTWCKGKLSVLLGTNILENIASKLKLQPQNVIFIACGNKTDAQKLLGKLRLLYKEELVSRNIEFTKSSSPYNFLWITDFPLFSHEDSLDNTGSTVSSTHHPFTAPHCDDSELLYKEPLKVRSQAYDLVLNGWEIGGGSIRIHDPKIQKYILSDVLKIEYEHLKHLIEALGSGCPPHGGIALGLDRLLAIICKATSIRDVIAFPKGVDGRDPLSGAPVPISEEEKQMYHIETRNCASSSDSSLKQDSTISSKRRADEIQEVVKKVKMSADE